MADTSYEPLRLYCGEWLEDEKRCYDHAAKHIGHHALTPHGLTQYALLDLRGLARRVS